MSVWILGATSWLATYLVQSTLLLLGALAFVGRLRDPAARERVWKIALTAPLLTASVGWLLPSGARPVLDLSPSLRAGMVPSPDAAPASPGKGAGSSQTMTTLIVNPSAPATSDVPVAPPREEPSRQVVVAPPRNWIAIAVIAVWAAGAAILLTRRAVALRHLKARLASRRTVRKGVALDLLADLCSDDELRRRPRLTLVDELSTPLVLGPGEICLPRRVVEELPRQELAAILAHEVAHVRRGDLFWLRACGLLECLLFAQPLNRLARRRLAQDAELLCDDWAGERTGARLELAQGLETVARWSRAAQRPLPVPCLGNEKGVLLQRVERLLAEPEARRRTVALTAALGGAVLLLAWAGPGVRLTADGKPDLDGLDTATLIALRKQSCAIATERLLALPEGWETLYARDLAVPGTKIARVLQRQLHHDLSPKDQGGAYYSFANDDHDYQRDPDIGYEGSEIRTAFAGDNTGHILDLGVVPLGSVTADLHLPGLDPESARLCSFLASHVPAGTGRADDAFIAAIGIPQSDVGRATATAGHTYLQRTIQPGRQDHLVAFTLVQVQPESIVLVGRELKTWPVKSPKAEVRPRVEWSSEGAPPWLTQLDGPSLFALQGTLAGLIERRLLGVSSAAIRASTGLGPPKDVGITRLLQRGRYDGVLLTRGAGCYYSFATGSHSYDDEPDLELAGDRFSSGFYGGTVGALLDVGDVALADLDPDNPPPRLNEEQLRTWNLFHAPALTQDERRLGRVPVVLDHSYIVRSSMPDEHDLLAAFRPVEQTDDGVTIAWRLLQRYPTPTRR
ncbi:MAG TPA: M56 family metallopeptidase [Planctomycetota bacterium]|nr:M56 family metallopeptidase [Planctomycetota bacterium]